MKMRNVLLGMVLVTSLAGAAIAADDEAPPSGRHARFVHRMGLSVEHAAMRNIMAEAVSAKTGRSVAEIQALMKDKLPHEAARELGLSESDMKSLFKQSRMTLIQRAASAGLITAEQAEELRKAPMPDRRHDRLPPELPEDEG